MSARNRRGLSRLSARVSKSPTTVTELKKIRDRARFFTVDSRFLVSLTIAQNWICAWIATMKANVHIVLRL